MAPMPTWSRGAGDTPSSSLTSQLDSRTTTKKCSMRDRLRGVRVLLSTSWRADRLRTAIILSLAISNAALGAIQALWMKLFVDAAMRSLREAALIAILFGVSSALSGATSTQGELLRMDLA